MIMSAIYGIKPDDNKNQKLKDIKKSARIHGGEAIDNDITENIKKELTDFWMNEIKDLDTNSVREKSLAFVKTFKTIKAVIWQSTV